LQAPDNYDSRNDIQIRIAISLVHQSPTQVLVFRRDAIRIDDAFYGQIRVHIAAHVPSDEAIYGP